MSGVGGGFEVEPVDLQANGSQYAGVADQVGAIQRTLLDKLNAQGECWGDDESGAQIAKTYVGPAVKALQQMAVVDGGVQEMAAATSTWAKNYQAVETA